MSKAEKTKQFIIEKTSVLFNKRGYLGTSLSDITEETGLTKGSIYGNFENKEAVAQAVYRHNAAAIAKKVLNATQQTSGGAADKLFGVVKFYRENWEDLIKSGGCPLLNAATEVDDAFPKLMIDVRKSFRGFSRMLVKIIEEGINEKIFRKDVNTGECAATIIMLIEGGVLLAKTMDDKNYLNTALDRVERIVRKEMMT